jgi:hypothetical protein
MTATRETVQAVGDISTGFLKSGPRHSGHLEETQTDVFKLARSIVTTTQEATASYERVCKDFLDKVIQVRGMPTRVISGGDENQSQTVSSSGSHIAQIFDTLGLVGK